MKKTLAIGALCALLSTLAVAQNRVSYAGLRNAHNYAYGTGGPGTPPALTIDNPTPIAAGSATITVAFGSVTAGDGTIFAPLSTSAPVTVGSGTDTETVTPSAVSCATPSVYDSCTFTATFSNAHGRGELVSSGTFGLQEAALAAKAVGGGLVALDWTFFKAASLTTNAGLTTYLGGFNSVSANVTILNWGGITGALSYGAAAGSAYASNAHILY